MAEEYNYPVSDNIVKKLTNAVNFMDRDAKEYLTWLGIPRKKVLVMVKFTLNIMEKISTLKTQAESQKCKKPYEEFSIVFRLFNESHTKGKINRDRKEYKIFNYKRKKMALVLVIRVRF